MEQIVNVIMKLGAGVVVAIIILAFILPQALRILREYERGVIFRLGKLLSAKGPGLIFLIPMVDRMVKMDLRVVTIDVSKQEIMTRDNVPATVDAVVYFRVVDPIAAVVKVENYWKATSLCSTPKAERMASRTALASSCWISRITTDNLIVRGVPSRAASRFFTRRRHGCSGWLPFAP